MANKSESRRWSVSWILALKLPMCQRSAYRPYKPSPESGHVTQSVMLATIQLALLLLCPVTNYLTLTQSQILPALPQAPEFK